MARVPVKLRFIALAVALAIVCVVPLAVYAAQTLALSSGTFAFEVDPGQTGEGEVVVINDGDEPIKVLVYVADVAIDETGVQTYPLPERQGASLLTTPASWFRIFMPADSKSVGNTPYLELDVAERVPVKFDFTPPTGTAPGDHNTVIFFEMFEFAQDTEGSAAQVSGRIGARVALRVSGEIVEDMSIRPFEVPAFVVGTEVPYDFTVVNGGNLNKPIVATATLLDRSEKEVASAVVASETTVYARSNLQLSGKLDTVAGRLGPHTVEARVQYTKEGADLPTEVVEQRTVWLFPLWLLITAAVLVFVGAVALATRLMRGRGRREHSEDRPVQRSSSRARGSEAEERRRRREERATQDADVSLDEIAQRLDEDASAGEQGLQGG